MRRRLLLLCLLSLPLVAWSLSGAPAPAIPDSGRTYDVRILRDSWGVPHVFGRTDADTAFGLAWAHAEDDFRTIQLSLLASRGRLAAVQGRKAAKFDFLSRWLQVQKVARAQAAVSLSPQARAVADAYAEGINRYAALHPNEVLPGAIPISSVDLVAGFYFQNSAFVLGSTLRRLLDEDQPFEKPQEPRGSNSFAVGPSRSSDGHTRLAVNSHQPWTGPVAWYEVHLHSEQGWDAVGGVFPGSPVILHGHNRNLGWAHTVNQPDLVDVYRLDIDPKNPMRYRLDGAWKELESFDIPIRVHLFGPISWTFHRKGLRSVHGPVVRRKDGTYAVRFAGMGEAGELEQIYRMNKARNLEEFLDAMRLQRIPMFNTVYADRTGNIYYVYNAKLPLRAPGFDWKGVLPGDRSDLIWTKYLPYDRLPQVLNPPSGLLINCNSTPYRATVGPGNPRPEDFDPNLGIETGMTNRALRALELFGGDDSISREEFYAYKFDMKYSTQSDVAKWRAELVARGRPDDPLLAEAWEKLRDWDLGTEPTNRGAALGVMTFYPYWIDVHQNGEKPDPMELLRSAAERLTKHFGRLDPPWGEVNRLRRGSLDLPIGGGPDVLHAVYGKPTPDGRFEGVAGDSYILLVDWGPDGRVSSRSIHQFGSATLDKSSPHYADQAVLFTKRLTKPVWMDEADIRANLEREYVPAGATPPRMP